MTDHGIVNRLILEADRHAAARDRLYMECARLTGAVEDLREQLAAATAERAHAVAVLGEDADRFRAERDEARREVCELRCNPPERFIGLPHELAKVNGWDCYMEDANAQGQ